MDLQDSEDWMVVQEQMDLLGLKVPKELQDTRAHLGLWVFLDSEESRDLLERREGVAILVSQDLRVLQAN